MALPTRKSVIFELAIAIGIFVVLPALFVFAADPCHVFHKPFNAPLHHGFTPETRCQDAGLLNSWLQDKSEDFDSILVGASTSENFLIPYINQKTPWKKTLSLTMVNMMPVEQNIVVKRAMDSGNVRHVFWEILPMLHHPPNPMDFNSIANVDYFPAYLYNKSWLDDYRYIFNAFTFSGSMDVLTQESYFINDINKIRYWENHCETLHICDHYFQKEDIEKIQRDYVAPARHLLTEKDRKKILYRDFDNFIYPVIKDNCNKNASIDLFFPPFSLLWFSQLPENDFYFELYLLRHAVEKTATCKNIRVFAFYNELWITADLSNYSDPKHFYGEIHNYIIDSIATNRNRITVSNIGEFEETMVKNLNAYQPYGTKLYPH